MLVRVLLKNLFSFYELTEFNMLPGRFGRLHDHVYKAGDIEVMKLNAIYGANGAGKSNLLKAIELLQLFLNEGIMPIEFITETFKFDKESKKKDVYIGVEFIKNNISYYYDVTINQGIVVEEELMVNGHSGKEDNVLFSRKDEWQQKNLSLTFAQEIENDKDASLFPSFLKNEMLERNQLVLPYMKNRQNKVFEPFKNALEWFTDNLVLIMPSRRPVGLAMYLENDDSFLEFANEIMSSFNTGISNIDIETIPIEDFFGEDDKHEGERMAAQLRAKPELPIFLRSDHEEIVFVLKDNKAVAKKIVFSHCEDNGEAKFEYAEESDGTRRLMDFLPFLYKVLTTENSYFIDEIERSIHPLLIKELLAKFSFNKGTKGQLIFSTHESNLLDQDIFRPDEIWFVEKNKIGATEMYALSEFKEHHTKDIRRGYLQGRYGAIPFMGNLTDLNWNKYAKAN